jgi:hypothetical protein
MAPIQRTVFRFYNELIAAIRDSPAKNQERRLEFKKIGTTTHVKDYAYLLPLISQLTSAYVEHILPHSEVGMTTARAIYAKKYIDELFGTYTTSHHSRYLTTTVEAIKGCMRGQYPEQALHVMIGNYQRDMLHEMLYGKRQPKPPPSRFDPDYESSNSEDESDTSSSSEEEDPSENEDKDKEAEFHVKTSDDKLVKITSTARTDRAINRLYRLISREIDSPYKQTVFTNLVEHLKQAPLHTVPELPGFGFVYPAIPPMAILCLTVISGEDQYDQGNYIRLARRLQPTNIATYPYRFIILFDDQPDYEELKKGTPVPEITPTPRGPGNERGPGTRGPPPPPTTPRSSIPTPEDPDKGSSKKSGITAPSPPSSPSTGGPKTGPASPKPDIYDEDPPQIPDMQPGEGFIAWSGRVTKDIDEAEKYITSHPASFNLMKPEHRQSTTGQAKFNPKRVNQWYQHQSGLTIGRFIQLLDNCASDIQDWENDPIADQKTWDEVQFTERVVSKRQVTRGSEGNDAIIVKFGKSPNTVRMILTFSMIHCSPIFTMVKYRPWNQWN